MFPVGSSGRALQAALRGRVGLRCRGGSADGVTRRIRSDAAPAAAHPGRMAHRRQLRGTFENGNRGPLIRCRRDSYICSRNGGDFNSCCRQTSSDDASDATPGVQTGASGPDERERERADSCATRELRVRPHLDRQHEQPVAQLAAPPARHELRREQFASSDCDCFGFDWYTGCAHWNPGGSRVGLERRRRRRQRHWQRVAASQCAAERRVRDANRDHRGVLGR